MRLRANLLPTAGTSGGTLSDDPINILVVDDNPADVTVLRLAFLESNIACQLHFFPKGTEAVTFLRENHRIPDLIILDLRLPGENGLEILQSVRRHSAELERVPAVLLSGLVSPENRAAAEACDALCLEKPFTFEGWMDLASTLKAFCSKGSQLSLAAA
jgi:CheY-like chemotaxis protein